MENTILSYNVNGIRAALTKGLAQWIKEQSPDILCIQETKAQPEQIDKVLFEHLGYFITANSAEKKGYSGVAIFSKKKPDFIQFGIGNDQFDSEGRVIRADFGPFSMICSYIPSGTTGDVRQDFKMEFLDAYTNYITNLRKKRPNLILSGDFNICHKPIDINKPEKHTKMSGFLPEERAWFDSFIETGMVDSFRLFNNKPDQYTWWTFRANAKEKNLGWRIDYHLVTEPMKDKVRDASIHPEVNFSDHCPISIKIDI